MESTITCRCEVEPSSGGCRYETRWDRSWESSFLSEERVWKTSDAWNWTTCLHIQRWTSLQCSSWPDIQGEFTRSYTCADSHVSLQYQYDAHLEHLLKGRARQHASHRFPFSSGSNTIASAVTWNNSSPKCRDLLAIV